MKKRTVCLLCAAAGLLLSLWLLQRLLTPKYQTGVVEGSMVEEYYGDPSPHEVLFIGDCEVYENFSPITLWEDFGVTSYIRGSAQQLVWQSYYLLEDALRSETPRVVVFNVLALKYDRPQSEAYNRMTLDGMRWSAYKVRAIRASMTDGEHFVEYLFPLLRYHSRWAELTADDFTHLFSKDPVTHNGYYMRVDSKAQTGFPRPSPLVDSALGENAMGYLTKMADLCAEKGVALVLIKAPTEYPHWYEEWDRQVADFAAARGLDYINYIPLQEEIGLDLSVDTYDAGLHLNNQGAEKLTRYFGRWLTERFDLTDGRQDAALAALWQEKTQFYNEMRRRQFDELARCGELVSFGANAIPGRNG